MKNGEAVHGEYYYTTDKIIKYIHEHQSVNEKSFLQKAYEFIIKWGPRK